MKKILISILAFVFFNLQAMESKKVSTLKAKHTETEPPSISWLPSQCLSSLPISLQLSFRFSSRASATNAHIYPPQSSSNGGGAQIYGAMTIQEITQATSSRINSFLEKGNIEGLQQYKRTLELQMQGKDVYVQQIITNQIYLVQQSLVNKDVQALVEIKTAPNKRALELASELMSKQTDQAIIEGMRHILAQKEKFQEYMSDPFALAAEFAKEKDKAEQIKELTDMMSTSVDSVPNISKDVDARIEAALSKLTAIDPVADLEGFLALLQTVLNDLKEQGLLIPDPNRDQEVLGIFAKALLRRLNPITQFKDVAKLTYHLGKKVFLEMHPHWTAAEIEKAHSSWDRFYETLKAMDPRSLTQEEWAEFLGTVVGDFAFFGGIGKVVHYFAQAPVTIEAIQARPLDYAHSVIQNQNKLNQGCRAILKNGYYEVNGLKFTERYYARLWNEGRKAPSLITREILDHATHIAPDKFKGFFRYEYKNWELVFNPTTKEVWHLQPMKK